MNEFGQPETIYDGPNSLIVATHVYPKRFCQETHDLVARLIAVELSMPGQPEPDVIK